MIIFPVLNCRDSIGSSAIVGDPRWAGAYGVEADFIARGHCAVEYIKIQDIEVLPLLWICVQMKSLAQAGLNLQAEQARLRE